jgi:hypothetical protein
MDGPVILSSYDSGRHNADLDATISRLDREAMWKDVSTVIVTPAGGSIPTRVVATWLSMMKPPNGKSCHLWALGTEVGEAYSRMIEGVLAHPDLSTWKYLLTIEHDQTVPPDGMVKLLAQMEKHPEYAAIGGLYFTKGPGGCAQIWGDPREMPMNFRPQRPVADALIECNGTGMGFTLFRMAMFKDERLRRPWFKTVASAAEGVGTQDLYAWGNFRQHGYRCAVDCSVRVGHMDAEGTVW